jgi:hypothetical protein
MIAGGALGLTFFSFGDYCEVGLQRVLFGGFETFHYYQKGWVRKGKDYDRDVDFLGFFFFLILKKLFQVKMIPSKTCLCIRRILNR